MIFKLTAWYQFEFKFQSYAEVKAAYAFSFELKKGFVKL